MKNRTRLIAFFLAAAMLESASGAEAAVFSTWQGLEADKCASIWLIKRFIAPEAEIRFYPRGETITEGIPFDTPEARFRRYYNKSTFETLQEHYPIADERVIYIGRIIHDIEVNIWEKKAMAETQQVISEVQTLIAEDNPGKIVEDCQAYFDRLYEEQN